MEQIIIGTITAFLVTFYAIPVIIRVAQVKKLFDVPNERKIHKSPIPSLGGLGIFVGFTISVLLFVKMSAAPEFQYYIAAFLLLFFVGIKDDILDISALKKFIGQMAAAGIIMFKGKLLITSMHGFLGVHELDVTISYLLTFFTIAVIINAFNLIDGVDGLCGSVAMVTTSVFGTYFFLNQDYAYAVLSFAMAGSLLGFLIYNFNPAKIFMGDTGSMIIGIVNAILVIRLIQTGTNATNLPLVSTPAVGFGILLFPLMDTLRVFAIRAFDRRSPFSPDRNHLHHILLDRGFSHKAVTLTIAGLTLVVSVIVFFTDRFGVNTNIFTLVALFLAGIYLLYATNKRSKMRVIKGDMLNTEDKEYSVRRLVTVLPKQSAAVAEEN